MTVRERLDSLDVFRGLTLAGMILVNTPGTWDHVYPPLEHAAWNGWTPTDLVFPFLLFAMGAAVPFAVGRRRNTGGRGIGYHVVRRASILFALGLVLNAIQTPPLLLATLRIPGVLQRIALVYLAVVGLTSLTSTRTQLIAAAAILVGYWMAMTLPLVDSRTMTAEYNLGAYIDQRVFGRHLLYPLWDPEGLLSTAPAVVTALGGVFAGEWLKRPYAPHRWRWLWIGGAIAAVIGLVWDRVFPINKQLWTSSFAMFTAGMAALGLAACERLLEVVPRIWAMPFIALGRNALAGYFLSAGLDSILTHWQVAEAGSLKNFVYETVFDSSIGRWYGGEAASLGYALTYVVIWTAVLVELQRRRIFIAI